jgi:hypothetical protein
MLTLVIVLVVLFVLYKKGIICQKNHVSVQEGPHSSELNISHGNKQRQYAEMSEIKGSY